MMVRSKDLTIQELERIKVLAEKDFRLNMMPWKEGCDKEPMKTILMYKHFKKYMRYLNESRYLIWSVKHWFYQLNAEQKIEYYEAALECYKKYNRQFYEVEKQYLQLKGDMQKYRQIDHWLRKYSPSYRRKMSDMLKKANDCLMCMKSSNDDIKRNALRDYIGIYFEYDSLSSDVTYVDDILREYTKMYGYEYAPQMFNYLKHSPLNVEILSMTNSLKKKFEVYPMETAREDLIKLEENK